MIRTALAAALVFASIIAFLGPKTAAAEAKTPGLQSNGSADWPQWRGPNRDGVAPSSPKLLDKWPANGPPQLWKNSTIGTGRDGGVSCPVIANGKLFVYSNQYKKAPSGKKLITAEVIEKMKELKFSGRWGGELKTETLAPLRDKDFKSIAELFVEAAKYVNMADGADAKLYSAVNNDAFVLNDIIFCLDPHTGKEIWRKEFPAEGLKTPPIWAMMGASGTPAVSGDRLIVQGSVALYCLSAKDGSLLWKVKTGFCNSSPLILGNEVVTGTAPRQAESVSMDLHQIGGPWTAYDLATGKQLWSSKIGGSGWGASVISWKSNNKLTLLVMGPSCIDAQSGAVLGDAVQSEKLGCWATPSIAGDIVLSRSESTVAAFKIALPKIEKLWECRLGGNEFESHSPLIYQGYVYTARQSVRCLDLKTGEQKWQSPKDISPETSTPLVVDGKLIENAGSNHADWNETVMLRASPEKCEVLGKIGHHAAPCTSPVVANGLLYVRLLDGLVCYDLRQ